MRISGGSAKGRSVRVGRAFSKESCPEELRPTSAKVRKAVFDILQDRVLGAHFVDLYAGTGAVGLEALSRGAEEATFVESSGARVRAIQDLAARFGFGGRARFIRVPAQSFLRSSAGASAQAGSGPDFDIIFADPPYASGEIETTLALIGGASVLKEGGTLIVEHSSRTPLPAAAGALRLTKTYRYGDTSLSVYRICGAIPGTVAQETCQ